MSHGEIFFNIGIAAIVISVLLGIATFVIFHVLRSRLNRQLDQEYGSQKKTGKKSVWSGSVG